MKKFVYIVIAVAILGGIAFTLTQTKLLEGTFKSGPTLSDEAKLLSQASAAVEDAITAASDAETAYNNNDESSLSLAVEAATAAVVITQSVEDQLNTIYENASTEYQSNLYTWKLSYQQKANDAKAAFDLLLSTAISEWPNYYEDGDTALDAEEVYNQAMADYTSCLSKASSKELPEIAKTLCENMYITGTASVIIYSGPTINEAKELADALETAFNTWNPLQTASDDYYADYVEASEEANSIAETNYAKAVDYNIVAKLYTAKAQSYTIDSDSDSDTDSDAGDEAVTLTCSELSISPTSYEMAASDTEASFDIEITLTAATKNTAWSSQLKLLQAFVFGGSSSTKGSGSSGSSSEEELNWKGNLRLKSTARFGSSDSSSGSKSSSSEFTYSTQSGNPLSIDMDGQDSITVKYSGGAVGDTLSFEMTGEETKCSATLKVSQAEAESASSFGVTIIESSQTTAVTEGSTTDTYTITLDTKPENDVTITVTPDSQLTVSPSTLTFTSANWFTDQMITVTAVDDSTVEGSHSATIKHSAKSSDSNYDAITIKSVTATITDNDQAVATSSGSSSSSSTSSSGSSSSGSSSTSSSGSSSSGSASRDAATIIGSEEYSCSDPFLDTEDWYEDIVCRMYNADVVQGRSSVRFVPDDNISRAEWIKVLTLIFGYDTSDADGQTESFADVSKSDWFYPYVVIAEDTVIKPARSGSNFNPNLPITRADALLYAVRMAGESTYEFDIEDKFKDVKNSDYFSYALAIATETTVDVPTTQDDGSVEMEEDVAIIEGYDNGTFKPYSYIKRSEAMAIALRVSLAWGIASE